MRNIKELQREGIEASYRQKERDRERERKRKKNVHVAEVNQWCCLEESEQWLENVD